MEPPAAATMAHFERQQTKMLAGKREAALGAAPCGSTGEKSRFGKKCRESRQRETKDKHHSGDHAFGMCPARIEYVACSEFVLRFSAKRLSYCMGRIGGHSHQ